VLRRQPRPRSAASAERALSSLPPEEEATQRSNHRDLHVAADAADAADADADATIRTTRTEDEGESTAHHAGNPSGAAPVDVKTRKVAATRDEISPWSSLKWRRHGIASPHPAYGCFGHVHNPPGARSRWPKMKTISSCVDANRYNRARPSKEDIATASDSDEPRVAVAEPVVPRNKEELVAFGPRSGSKTRPSGGPR
jgi:hypothetical protein